MSGVPVSRDTCLTRPPCRRLIGRPLGDPHQSVRRFFGWSPTEGLQRIQRTDHIFRKKKNPWENLKEGRGKGGKGNQDDRPVTVSPRADTISNRRSNGRRTLLSQVNPRTSDSTQSGESHGNYKVGNTTHRLRNWLVHVGDRRQFDR